ncbi:HAD family hydrolase [Allofournierella sp.]|uniref:HAD family hydrolase n=1 Tax=Allofournierella sp. TaxID=1940256 RepID=UPI003AB70567
MIKAVLFDMDGLMFDTERMYHDAWLELGRRRGLAMTEEIVTGMRGRNRQGCVALCREAFGAKFDFTELRDACVERMEAAIAEKGLPKRPGLDELLGELARRGLPAVLATSTSRATALRYLELAGVSGYFKGAVCGDEVEHSKPAPDIFLRAAALAGVPPRHCMVLEDSPNGLRAGAAAGCRAVMVPDLDPVTPELAALAAAVVPSLREAIPLLDTL